MPEVAPVTMTVLSLYDSVTGCGGLNHFVLNIRFSSVKAMINTVQTGSTARARIEMLASICHEPKDVCAQLVTR
jgi:chemotaxis receptor (MCP) glutamine deamidase CheD